MLPGHCQAGMKGVVLVGQGAMQSDSTAAASSSPTTSQSSGSSGGHYGSFSGPSTISSMAKLGLLSTAVVIAALTI